MSPGLPAGVNGQSAEASRGNRDAADQRYRALTTLLARHELEPADETTRLHREITSPTRIG